MSSSLMLLTKELERGFIFFSGKMNQNEVQEQRQQQDKIHPKILDHQQRQWS